MRRRHNRVFHFILKVNRFVSAPNFLSSVTGFVLNLKVVHLAKIEVLRRRNTDGTEILDQGGASSIRSSTVASMTPPTWRVFGQICDQAEDRAPPSGLLQLGLRIGLHGVWRAAALILTCFNSKRTENYSDHRCSSNEKSVCLGAEVKSAPSFLSFIVGSPWQRTFLPDTFFFLFVQRTMLNFLQVQPSSSAFRQNAWSPISICSCTVVGKTVSVCAQLWVR